MTRLNSNIAAAHQELASRINSARLAAGMTQADLAGRIGRDQTFISKVEGRERRLGVIEFVQITDALGADAMAILEAVANRLRPED